MPVTFIGSLVSVLSFKPECRNFSLGNMSFLVFSKRPIGKSANDSQEVLFLTRGHTYDEESLPDAGKTSTKPVHAGSVYGGRSGRGQGGLRH